MGHKKRHHKKKKHSGKSIATAEEPKRNKLEICLKCDSTGTLEAVIGAIQNAAPNNIAIDIIHAGIGAINKTDIFLAQTGSHLLLGFEVNLNPDISNMALEYGIEIHLHDTIYRLVEDVRTIAQTLVTTQVVEEKILGSAKVIALFKSSRKGIILGCEVLHGRVALQDRFRITAAAGTIYDGVIESLHIEKNAVNSAKQGQQVGLKIRNFKKATIGNIVESYKAASDTTPQQWQPRPGVFRLTAKT